MIQKAETTKLGFVEREPSMLYHPSPPWPRIHEYLVEVGAARDALGLAQAAAQLVGGLIPYDVSVNLFIKDGHECLFTHGTPELLSLYNRRYMPLNPILSRPDLPSIRRLDWADYANTEYVTDFMRPNGIRHTLEIGRAHV